MEAVNRGDSPSEPVEGEKGQTITAQAGVIDLTGGKEEEEKDQRRETEVIPSQLPFFGHSSGKAIIIELAFGIYRIRNSTRLNTSTCTTRPATAGT